MVLLVRGEVRFEERAPSFSGATLYVRLEEVTTADAAARIVSEEVRRDVALDPGADERLTSSLTGGAPNPRASYSVRAHVDIDGDGQVSAGDFISTQSYPVLTSGHPDQVSVLVQRVS
jgi:uncharacterized lipoprotein YbaY